MNNITRTVKDPETRRNELIGAAEELFLANGYEGTTVANIVRKIGVAQGTFYHYFRSKEGVLDAIIDRCIDEITEEVEGIASRDDSDAIEKILRVFNLLNSLDRSWQKLTEYIFEEKNARLLVKFEKRVPQVTTPRFSRMIEEGVEEGLFDVKYPDMAALSIIGTAGIISYIYETYRLEENAEKVKEITAATFYFIERILGAEQGIFIKYASRMAAST